MKHCNPINLSTTPEISTQHEHLPHIVELCDDNLQCVAEAIDSSPLSRNEIAREIGHPVGWLYALFFSFPPRHAVSVDRDDLEALIKLLNIEWTIPRTTSVH